MALQPTSNKGTLGDFLLGLRPSCFLKTFCASFCFGCAAYRMETVPGCSLYKTNKKSYGLGISMTLQIQTFTGGMGGYKHTVDLIHRLGISMTLQIQTFTGGMGGYKHTVDLIHWLGISMTLQIQTFTGRHGGDTSI